MSRIPIAITLAVGLVLAACGGGSSGGSPSGGAAAGIEVKVGLSDFAFTPKTIEVPADKKFTLALTNTGSVEHDFTVDALKINVVVPPNGKPKTQEVGPLKAGTYDLYCAVAGHKEAGMTAKLVVK
ncbi:MAG TPA: cupredoxin domain-containing protein [Candidatus Limnocylindria bacterium]|jgi:uncharacterized cupredoxin-like copper-binding protein